MNRRTHLPDLRSERGIALLAASLTLVLVAVLALAFMTTMRGERAQSSNVQVARGSLYAADAGVRATQQYLANLARTRLDSLALLYPGSGAIIQSPGSFFPAGAIAMSASNPKYSTVTTIAWADSNVTDSSQVYNYRYTVTSTGESGAQGERVVQSQGYLRVSASRGSFADFLVFTNQHKMADGSKIWFTSDGHFDGRIHTNGQFRFAYQPTFEDLVSSVNPLSWFYNHGNPIELDGDNNGTIDVPNFFGGYQHGAPQITLPPNSYGQQNAALGFAPQSTLPPSNYDINQALGLGSSTSPPASGIYLPNNGTALTGGIYVQGNLGSCAMSVDSLGRQVYRMQQGGTLKIITVDYALGLTSISDGTTLQSYAGVPRGVLYTNGAIDNLGGPDRVNGAIPPALAEGTQLLVTARDDITLNNDMTYQNYDSGRSVLGLYSDDGSVRIGTDCPNDMHLDAFVMAAGADAEFTVDNFNGGDPRGTFHLRGGIVEQFYGAFYTFDDGNLRTGYARDFRYDRRGVVPPYYPTTPLLIPNMPAARTVAWKEQ